MIYRRIHFELNITVFLNFLNDFSVFSLWFFTFKTLFELILLDGSVVSQNWKRHFTKFFKWQLVVLLLLMIVVVAVDAEVWSSALLDDFWQTLFTLVTLKRSASPHKIIFVNFSEFYFSNIWRLFLLLLPLLLLLLWTRFVTLTDWWMLLRSQARLCWERQKER